MTRKVITNCLAAGLLMVTSCTENPVGQLRSYILAGDTTQLAQFSYLTTNVNVRLGAEPPGRFETALHLAVKAGQYDVVTQLLGMGADPNLPDSEGRTPLMAAVASTYIGVTEDSRAKIVQLLLQGGVNLEQKDKYGDTALILAVIMDHPRFVRQLLKAGATVNVRDKYGNTLLHLVRGPELAMLSVESGCDLNAVNRGGNTPAMVQLNEARWEVLKAITNSVR